MARLRGINATRFLREAPPDELVGSLPAAFGSMLEYRNYLLDNLIRVPEKRVKFLKLFKNLDRSFLGTPFEAEYLRYAADAIVGNDHYGSALQQFSIVAASQRVREKADKAREEAGIVLEK